MSDHFLALPPCKDVTLSNVANDIKKPRLQPVFELKTVTEREVHKIINNITTNSSGQDGICIKMIKLTLHKTLPTITAIVNKSIENHTFPAQWKHALIRPIPKKNNVDELKELRPISLLPILSKVLEKVVLDQVIAYLDNQDVIPKFQSGFRRGHGTETALLHVTDDIVEASDKGYLIDTIRLHPSVRLSAPRTTTRQVTTLWVLI